ncbi:hypothetical protein [Flavobacterium psychrophilum]|uniref:hypothetical protein n=1 Tax=Flavobacterium psychrophilum TaxID=96345 RepID=UPI001069C44E|nr:hypothetical protein [Flavobacterium psychrophilum]
MKYNVPNSKRIMFFFERKSMSILLWVLTIASIALAIKSSNEPVLDFLKNSTIKNYLFQFSNANNFIWDITIGFLISVIFYLLVVYLPEKQKKKDIEPFINSKCEGIIFSSYALIQEIISKSNTEYQYKTLTQQQLIEICKNVNPKEHFYHFHNGPSNTFQNHLGYMINNSWLRIIKEVDEIMRLLPYIDSGLLRRIYKLSNNFLKYTANDLSVIEKLKNDNLESWSPTFYDLYIETKELRDYYILYTKRSFINDPWK